MHPAMALLPASWWNSRPTQHKHRLISHLQAARCCLSFGYRTVGGDFITLEYSFLDLGPKRIMQPELANWFSKESENIHQEMYDLATKGRALGGSEVMPLGRSS